MFFLFSLDSRFHVGRKSRPHMRRGTERASMSASDACIPYDGSASNDDGAATSTTAAPASTMAHTSTTAVPATTTRSRARWPSRQRRRPPDGVVRRPSKPTACWQPNGAASPSIAQAYHVAATQSSGHFRQRARGNATTAPACGSIVRVRRSTRQLKGRVVTYVQAGGGYFLLASACAATSSSSAAFEDKRSYKRDHLERGREVVQKKAIANADLGSRGPVSL